MLVASISPEIFTADSQDPQAICGGDKSFGDCGTARTFMEEMKKQNPELPQYRHNQSNAGEDGGDEFIYYSIQAQLPLGCVACRQICEIVPELRNGLSTEKARLITMPPELYLAQRALILKKITDELQRSIEEKKADRLIEFEPQDD